MFQYIFYFYQSLCSGLTRPIDPREKKGALQYLTWLATWLLVGRDNLASLIAYIIDNLLADVSVIRPGAQNMISLELSQKV